MKTKISKVLGIGFALILVASLMLFALPAAAGPYEDLEPAKSNMWAGFSPTAGIAGLWYFDPDIDQVGPIAEAINGDIYAYVSNVDGAGSDDIFKSVDDGRTWSVSTVPAYYTGGAVVDMVCSSMSEDVIYLTDGNYVYKSINGATSFTLVAQADLEKNLMGACGVTIVDFPITCIDVGYDASGLPIVLIGTKYITGHVNADGDPAVGTVLYIADETFSATWTDLQLSCYGCCQDVYPNPNLDCCYDVYSVAAAPGFDSVSKVYAVITAPLTSVTYTTGTTATIEIRAGDYGASFDYDSDTANVGTLTGSIDGGTGFDMSDTTDTITLPNANSTLTVTFDGTAGGAVDITAIDGTISWRLIPNTGDATFCGGTHVVSTLGTICSWTHVAEVTWNCLWSFEIQHASRMMFPSYYASEATLFVGVAAVEDTADTYEGWGEGGDVYRVTDALSASTCIDMNVQGFTTGCTGFNHANICSLDIDDNDALVAGAWDEYQLQSPTRVYYSADGGWTWAPSTKDPTGTDRTYVLFAADSVVAATRGCDCAFSISCGANLGDYFNQISLINIDIDAVLDMTHAPGYVFDSQLMYVLTFESNACDNQDIVSLLRWDGTYWERVFSSRFFAVASTQAASVFGYDPLYEWVEVSPDFNSTDCIYMANSAFYMTRSIDAGCSWAPLTYPCYDRPTVTAWIVVDEDTVLAAGGGADAGYVWRTTNHGAQPWSSFSVLDATSAPAGDGVDFDLSLPRAADSDVLLGDDYGQVFLSQDLGETWAEIADTATGTFGGQTAQTYVVFDPGYAVAGDPGENTFYAAAGTQIGRCAYDADALSFKQDWVYICPGAATCETCGLIQASGIDAVGDTVLYVADAGVRGSEGSSIVSGTMAVSYICDDTDPYTDPCTCDVTISETLTVTSGTIENNEPLAIVGYNLFCFEGYMLGDVTVVGLINGGFGTFELEEALLCEGCSPDFSVFSVVSSNLTAVISTSTTASTGVWRSVNPLDAMLPVALVEWEFLAPTTSPPTTFLHEEAGWLLGGSLGVNPDDLWLTAASNMLWVLDNTGHQDSPFDTIWMWDDPLATQVVQVSPADGALLATETTATLEWEALDGATLYEVKVYAECPECLNPNEMKDFTTETTSATCITITDLSPGKTYFWKVRVACNSPQVSKWSDLRSFDTALSATVFCSPDCGAEDISLTPNFSWSAVTGATSYEIEVSLTEDFASVLASGTPTINAWDGIPELDYSTTYYWRVRAVQDGIYSGWTYCLFSTIDEPAAPEEPVEPVDVTIKEITPTWIWVIIGIGGALTIVVIILIVTTRRVP